MSKAVERAYNELAEAIVVQAGIDYLRTKKKLEIAAEGDYRNRLLSNLADIEKFFQSRWCRELTDTDPDWFKEELDKAYDNLKKTNNLKLIDGIQLRGT